MPIVMDGTDSIGDLGDALAAKLVGVKSDTAPVAPATNDVWLDTSGTAGIWKIWNGSAWVSFSGGGPAVVSSTTGSPTITTISVSGVNHDVYVFAANGSITVSAEGLVDYLVVGGGGGFTGAWYGDGGRIGYGTSILSAATHTITVGRGGGVSPNATGVGLPSDLGTLCVVGSVASTSGESYTSGAGSTEPDRNAGFTSSITGTAVVYAAGSSAATAPGNGGRAAVGVNGVVIVRVKSP